MKIAVFGETGQVARALARLSSPERQIFTINRAEADFSDPDGVAAVADSLEADAIINAVAYTAVDRAEEEPELAERVNTTSVARLAKVAAARDIPLVHISTDYVFDGTGTHPRSPDAPTAPLGVYGQSKRNGERGIVAAGGRYAILRTSWVFSSDGSNFVKTMLRLSETRDRLNVVADQIGGPTAAHAIADASLQLAEGLLAGKDGGIYHFSGTPDVSWADFAREIFRQVRRTVYVGDIPTSDYPTPATRPLNSRLDCRSVEKDFGIARPDWKRDLEIVLKELE